MSSFLTRASNQITNLSVWFHVSFTTLTNRGFGIMSSLNVELKGSLNLTLQQRQTLQVMIHSKASKTTENNEGAKILQHNNLCNASSRVSTYIPMYLSND